MKIEFQLLKKVLEETKDECLKPVSDGSLMTDYMDKMFNFGVQHMFYKVLNKLDEVHETVKGVEQ